MLSCVGGIHANVPCTTQLAATWSRQLSSAVSRQLRDFTSRRLGRLYVDFRKKSNLGFTVRACPSTAVASYKTVPLCHKSSAHRCCGDDGHEAFVRDPDESSTLRRFLKEFTQEGHSRIGLYSASCVRGDVGARRSLQHVTLQYMFFLTQMLENSFMMMSVMVWGWAVGGMTCNAHKCSDVLIVELSSLCRVRICPQPS